MASEAQRRVVGEERFVEMERFIGCRTNIQSRNIIIQRSGQSFGLRALKGQGGQVGRWHSVWNLSSGFDQSDGDGSSIRAARDEEKKDLQELNVRLASFIEERHFYIIQIKKLEKDIERLKSQSGYDPSRLKALYEAELDEARRLLKVALEERAQVEMRLVVGDEAMEELRRRLDDSLKDAADVKVKFERLNQQLADYEGEISLLRRRLNSLESEKDKEKIVIETLQETIKVVRQDLNTETFLHIEAENRSQSLDEELKFLKSIYEQELRDLKALSSSDSMVNNLDYWKREMGKALLDIQRLYDGKIEEMRLELEERYTVQLQRIEADVAKFNMQGLNFKDDNTRLRHEIKIYSEKFDNGETKHAQVMRELARLRREREDFERVIREWEKKNGHLTKQITQLRDEREATLKEVKLIRDTKHGLELEIITYRRLLELEENRDGLLRVVNIDREASNSFSIGAELKEATIVERGTMSTGAGFKETTIVESGTMSTEHDSGFEQSTSFTEEHGRQTGFEAVTTVSSAKTMSERGLMNLTLEFKKTTTGSVAISECLYSGIYVAVENIGDKEELIGDWKLIRTINGRDDATYTFNKSVVLRPKEKIKVWSIGNKHSQGASDDLELNGEWGSDPHVITKLLNSAGEVRATFKQDLK